MTSIMHGLRTVSKLGTHPPWFGGGGGNRGRVCLGAGTKVEEMAVKWGKRERPWENLGLGKYFAYM